MAEEPIALAPVREGHNSDDIQRFANLYEEISTGTRALERSFRDSKVQIAVVGNSPCGIGSGLGDCIDAHDIIIRFNKAPSGGAFTTDYGSRTDIHVLPTRGHAETSCAPDAKFALFTTAYVLGRNRNWSYAMGLKRNGKMICCIPGDRLSRLASELGVPPSNGLRVSSYLRDLRGLLPRGSVFGFSFTDQIGPTAVSSHYFEQAKPSMHHNWHKERMIFENLLAPAI